MLGFGAMLPPHHGRQATECLHCPKLCRHACPVSSADGRETTTPWGKMGLLALVARGVLPFDEAYAAPWWACSGCMRCASHCDLGNEVADTLRVGRALAWRAGRAPAAVSHMLSEEPERGRRRARAARACFGEALRRTASVAYVPGCATVEADPELARRGLRVVSRLFGEPVRAEAEICCGLHLLEAGDAAAFRHAARRFGERLASFRHVVFEEPGCLHAMKVLAPRMGVSLPGASSTWMHLAEAAEVRWRAASSWRARPEVPVRYHDPCRLGRGLGVYNAPRRVLGRLLGRPPAEFTRRREDAECSGAGGLLPLTMPVEAQRIAESRAEEHRRLGGGIVVSCCPSAVRHLRGRGLRAAVLTEWLDRALHEG